jgi:hypothetical protein
MFITTSKLRWLLETLSDFIISHVNKEARNDILKYIELYIQLYIEI